MHYKIFVSPQIEDCSTNKYIHHFFDALSSRAIVVNYGKRKRSRSLDMLSSIFSANVMILHWAEDIAKLRLGYLQVVISMFSVVLFRLRGGKVVWFCHNRAPHDKAHYRSSGFLRRFYKLFATTIIVHSTDALEEMAPGSSTVYLAHPAYPETETSLHTENIEQFDILIWGSMLPYKGIERFIDSYKEHSRQATVLIVGKATPDYAAYLHQKAVGTNITIRNEYLEDDALKTYFEGCRFIVLPYLHTDTYCSGALIHSLNSGKIVLGPAIGNFVDVNRDSACLVYKDYDDLFDTIQHLLMNPATYHDCWQTLREGVAAYKQRNTWEEFTTDLLLAIEGKRPKRLNRKFKLNFRKKANRKRAMADIMN